MLELGLFAAACMLRAQGRAACSCSVFNSQCTNKQQRGETEQPDARART